MDGGAWWAIVHRVAKSRIRLGDFSSGDCSCSPCGLTGDEFMSLLRCGFFFFFFAFLTFLNKECT